MKKFILIAAVALAGAVSASAQINFESSATSTDELRSMAVKSNRLVFIDLFASWCGPCRIMDTQVFSRKDVGDYMNSQFVSVKYNMERGTGRQLAEKYGIKSIPTYLVFDTGGRLIGKVSGAMPPEDFIKSMKKVIANYDKAEKK